MSTVRLIRPDVPKATPGPSRAGFTLERRSDERIWLVRDNWERPVWVRRCFPWSEPGQFISLRNDDDEELALVGDVAELDEASRRVLEQALADAGFVFELTGVLGIDEEVEIRHWRVTTRQGERSFQTRLDDWPRELPRGGLLIRDLSGDLYHLPDPALLDKNSRKLLWAFVD